MSSAGRVVADADVGAVASFAMFAGPLLHVDPSAAPVDVAGGASEVRDPGVHLREDHVPHDVVARCRPRDAHEAGRVGVVHALAAEDLALLHAGHLVADPVRGRVGAVVEEVAVVGALRDVCDIDRSVEEVGVAAEDIDERGLPAGPQEPPEAHRHVDATATVEPLHIAGEIVGSLRCVAAGVREDVIGHPRQRVHDVEADIHIGETGGSAAARLPPGHRDVRYLGRVHVAETEPVIEAMLARVHAAELGVTDLDALFEVALHGLDLKAARNFRLEGAEGDAVDGHRAVAAVHDVNAQQELAARGEAGGADQLGDCEPIPYDSDRDTRDGLRLGDDALARDQERATAGLLKRRDGTIEASIVASSAPVAGRPVGPRVEAEDALGAGLDLSERFRDLQEAAWEKRPRGEPDTHTRRVPSRALVVVRGDDRPVAGLGKGLPVDRPCGQRQERRED